ncbi:MAG TPA: DegT/DnrJ/EryC1/StrS family aminotransferase [Candidatus Dormibacteraeota bacterium]|nr:DegT/DnrJ/EryC1/StrS family aminotransferase [Candidatus Dormibacteraeota bacterium]
MIPLVKATFYREAEMRERLAEFVLRAPKLSMGTECETFEQLFARYQGRRHCIMVNSGSSANLALIQALLNRGRLRAGDRVGFSALTWSTNVMPLLQLGLEPVPIDVELDTLNVSSRLLGLQLERAPIAALFLTDVLGWCDDIDRVRDLCAERDILLLEDACESLGSVYRGQRLGNFGLAATFSFYVGHQFSTIEGGAVCTDDDELADMLRIVRAHGWDRNLDRTTQMRLREANHVASTFYSRYTFYHCGYNLRPTEIAGFLGNVGLPYLDEIVRRREANYNRFAASLFACTDRYLPLRHDHLDVFSNFAVPIICRSEALLQTLVARCEEHIEIRPIVGGDMTQQPFFRRRRSPPEVYDLPNAALAHAQGLYVGNRPDLEPDEIDAMLDVFTGPLDR